MKSTLSAPKAALISNSTAAALAALLWAIAITAGCRSQEPVPDPRMQRAHALSRVESWGEAAALWADIYFASGGEDVDAGLQAASAMLEADEATDAWTVLVDVIARHPDRADAYELLGRASEDGGNPAAARENYSAAIDLDSTRAFAWQRVGELSCEAGEFDVGLDALERSAGLDPADQRTRVLLGMRLLEVGRNDRAASFLKDAIETTSASDSERLTAARALRADPRTIPWLKPIVRRDPLHSEALRLLGEATYVTGDHDHALTLLEDAARADPGDAEALASLARVLHQMGRTIRAKAVIQHAKGLDLRPFGERLIEDVEAEINAKIEVDLVSPQ